MFSTSKFFTKKIRVGTCRDNIFLYFFYENKSNLHRYMVILGNV